MSFPKTRPGNPERGWNDPPMFNFTPGVQSAAPKRTLNKRVAFPASSPPQPGHAVLNPSAGPPVLNPVLSGSVLSQPEVKAPPIPIGLRDTPLGNQAPPISPVQILPPSSDASAPQAVPLLVPGLVPAAPPMSGETTPQAGIQDERLADLMCRLSLSGDEELLQYNLNVLSTELNKYKSVLTLKICDDIKRKIDVIEDRWKNGGISEVVKVRLSQLAEALSNEKTDKANQLHLALMVDHISEVNQWMMGVKRLIQQQQLAFKEKELLSEKSDKPDGDNNDDGNKNQDANTSAVLLDDNKEAGNIDSAEKHGCEDEDVTVEPEMVVSGTESIRKETDSVTSEKESDTTESELVTAGTGSVSAEIDHISSKESDDTEQK